MSRLHPPNFDFSRHKPPAVWLATQTARTFTGTGNLVSVPEWGITWP